MMIRHKTLRSALGIVAAFVAAWASNATAQTVPSWEAVGVKYAYYVNVLADNAGSSLSAEQTGAVAGAYGPNAGAYSYWLATADITSTEFYEASYTQRAYWNWYSAYAAAQVWPQGAEYQSYVYEYYQSYGTYVSRWYSSYGDYVYGYYLDIADYYGKQISWGVSSLAGPEGSLENFGIQ